MSDLCRTTEMKIRKKNCIKSIPTFINQSSRLGSANNIVMQPSLIRNKTELVMMTAIALFYGSLTLVKLLTQLIILVAAFSPRDHISV